MKVKESFQNYFSFKLVGTYFTEVPDIIISELNKIWCLETLLSWIGIKYLFFGTNTT